MNLAEAAEVACQEKTLAEALTWIAIWEAERAIAQALEWQRTGISTAAHGNWDLCFGVCFRAVIEKHQDRVCPHVEAPLKCPICGKQPDVNECGPWPPSAKYGPAPWYTGCYSQEPTEHFVGVNGANRTDVISRWNLKVRKMGLSVAGQSK